jgi:hypothetical protein
MATNTLSVYDPLFYAQEALIQLENALGMAGRVHRGHDKDPQQKGSTISIREPSTFTAQNAPSAAQNITAAETQIVLDQWKDVAFSLTDKELTYTGERIITEHIRPAAYALANYIDQVLCGMYDYVPWEANLSSPAAVTDITAARKTLFNNQVPMDDNMLHMMLDGTVEAEFLNLQAFSQHQGAGDQGVDTQMRGYLGRKFGFEIFANQNTAEHTAGALVIGTQLQVNANISAGATSVVFKDSGGSLTGTIKAGDTFVIAGSTQRYVATADATAAANVISVSFEPKAAIDYSASDNVTATQQSGTQCLAFHKNAIALAMAPLSEIGAKLEGRVATVTDPVSNLSIRSRIFYEGKEAAIYVVLDVLFGFKMLKHNMAVRMVNA